MKYSKTWIVALSLLVAIGCAGEGDHEEPEAEAPAEETAPAEPSAADQIAQMEADCAAAAEAIAARQAEASLYDRLGGREKIEAVVTDIIGRHQRNEQIADMFETVDDAQLIEHVTDFISQAAGGDVVYEGRDMVSSHAHLGITEEDFLAAGGDVRAGLEAGGVGEDEVQEVTCMFVSLRSAVMTVEEEPGMGESEV